MGSDSAPKGIGTKTSQTQKERPVSKVPGDGSGFGPIEGGAGEEGIRWRGTYIGGSSGIRSSEPRNGFKGGDWEARPNEKKGPKEISMLSTLTIYIKGSRI